jgi:cyclic beta-1,2-glucan synthetase
MYRIGTEGLLGIHIRGRKLAIDPCIPRGWPGFQAALRHGSSRYAISVENPKGVNRGVCKAFLDGAEVAAQPCEFGLVDDGREHRIRVVLG